MKNTESMKSRYLSKIAGNFFTSGMGFLQQLILTRLLGPIAYGYLAFSRIHFQSIFNGLDLGSSYAFSTFAPLSKETYKKALGLYSLIIAAISLISLCYVFVIYEYNLSPRFWPDIEPSYMWHGFFLALGTYLSTVVVKVADANGLARKIEVQRSLASIAIILLFFGLFKFNLFTVKIAATSSGCIYFLSSFYLFAYIQKIGGRGLTLSKSDLSGAVKIFYTYCKPLAVLNVITAIFILIDRWLLQSSGGSVEQGYFGLCQQLSAGIFLLTSSMTPIFHKESAIAFAENNFVVLRNLFEKDIRRLFSLSAFLSVLTAINSKEIISFLAGSNYEGATTVAMLMFLYPIHQTYGQLSSTFLLAKGNTKQYLMVGCIENSFGILFSCIFLLPHDWFGFHMSLGAKGLAIKMLLAQLVNTSIYNMLSCRYLKISFLKMLKSDFLSLFILLVIGFLSNEGCSVLLAHSSFSNSIIFLLTKSLIFISFSIPTILFLPSIFGIERKWIKEHLILSKNLAKI